METKWSVDLIINGEYTFCEHFTDKDIQKIIKLFKEIIKKNK